MPLNRRQFGTVPFVSPEEHRAVAERRFRLCQPPSPRSCRLHTAPEQLFSIPGWLPECIWGFLGEKTRDFDNSGDIWAHVGLFRGRNTRGTVSPGKHRAVAKRRFSLCQPPSTAFVRGGYWTAGPGAPQRGPPHEMARNVIFSCFSYRKRYFSSPGPLPQSAWEQIKTGFLHPLCESRVV